MAAELVAAALGAPCESATDEALEVVKRLRPKDDAESELRMMWEESADGGAAWAELAALRQALSGSPG